MKTVTIKTGTEEEFFKRGQKIAKCADQGLVLPEEKVLSFEDPADLLKLLTPQSVPYCPLSVMRR